MAWGNGTTITGGTAHDHFHNHAASWGIVSIASHNSNVGDGTFQTEAINYLLEQNEDSASEFFGKLTYHRNVATRRTRVIRFTSTAPQGPCLSCARSIERLH